MTRVMMRFLLGLVLLPVFVVTILLALTLMVPGVERGMEFVIDGDKEERW